MSTDNLNTGVIEAAVNGDKASLRLVLQQLVANRQQNNVATGQSTLKKVDTQPASFNQPPSPAQFTVSGGDGNFTISITNPQNAQALSVKQLVAQAGSQPNLQNAQIFHELSSSLTPQFDDAGQVTTYPASPTLHYVFSVPSQSRYWRLRSSYDQKAWNAYQIYTASTGPVAIDAGNLSSGTAANNLSLNQSNYANVDSVGAVASATVRVYNSISGPNKSWVRVVGSTSSVLPSATILNVPYGSTQYVSYDGEKFQVKPQLPQVFPDNWIPAGQVSVVNSGSVVLPTITPVLSGGYLVGLSYTPGSGLTQPPILTVADPGGPGADATVTAVVSGGLMVGYNIGNAGNGMYDSHTTVTASGGVFAGSGGGGGQTGYNGGRIYVPQGS